MSAIWGIRNDGKRFLSDGRSWVDCDSENRREVWREEGSPARGIRGWRIYVEGFLRVFSHFEHHYFLNIFSRPFYIDFGSISDPNLDQKS